VDEIISIHSPHAGRDWYTGQKKGLQILISIHSPHAGRDIFFFIYYNIIIAFQSTLPMRGETFYPFL